jgi:hypothetical protein
MTKQEFLEGKEFKTLAESGFTYKYKQNAIVSAYNNGDFSYEANVEEITKNGFSAFIVPLGEIFRVKLEFKNLI